MIRPLPTGDAEFERIALRLVEAGFLDDLAVEGRAGKGNFGGLVREMTERLASVGDGPEIRTADVDYDYAAGWWRELHFRWEVLHRGRR